MSDERLDDPRTWWVRLVDAVAALQAGDKSGAAAYLKWVEEHRGRKVAESSRKTLLRLRDAPSWANCAAWKHNDYRPTVAKERIDDKRAKHVRPARC
jgi:hypothetical protein